MMQDLVDCDYFRALVIFRGLDNCNFVEDSANSKTNISDTNHRQYTNSNHIDSRWFTIWQKLETNSIWQVSWFFPVETTLEGNQLTIQCH